MKHYAPNRCEPRIEVIVKMHKKSGWGRGQGGCEPRIEVIMKCKKTKSGGWSGAGSDEWM